MKAGPFVREKFRTRFSSLEQGFSSAEEAFNAGKYLLGFDIYEQLLDSFQKDEVVTLNKAYEKFQILQFKNRYNQYQEREFNFNIQEGEKVLDVGSGNQPFPCATHLADISIDDNSYGRAGLPFVSVKGKTVYECNIESMDFNDNEFDFIYCSHVLEHVANPEAACSELMRIGKRGYIETPTKGKDIFLNTAGVSHHNWWIEIVNGYLVFTEYPEQEKNAVSTNILIRMHTAPKTERERAFSALLRLKPVLFNTMFAWEEKFSYSVQRQSDCKNSSVSTDKNIHSDIRMKDALADNNEKDSGKCNHKQKLSIVQIHTFYTDYLQEYYCRNNELKNKTYREQLASLINDGFSVSHLFAWFLDPHVFDSHLIIANCEHLQRKWCEEHNIPVKQEILNAHDLDKIALLQLHYYKPDILYLSNPVKYDDSFIQKITPRPAHVIGWRAAGVKSTTRWDNFDLLLSHLSVCREKALQLGAKSVYHFFPGIPDFIPGSLAATGKEIDVVFCGQWTSEHTKRNNLIQHLVRKWNANNRPFSLGLFLAGEPGYNIPPEVKEINAGAKWGKDMYSVLKKGRIVLNAEIDIAGDEAGNMRMFEATAMGSFLLTEYHPGIEQYFIPGREIETFDSFDTMYTKIEQYLSAPNTREQIAERAQKKYFDCYTMKHRAAFFADIVLQSFQQKRGEQGIDNETMQTAPSRFYINANPVNNLQKRRFYQYHCRKTGGRSITYGILSKYGNASEMYQRLASAAHNTIRFGDETVTGWNKGYLESGAFFYGFSHLPMHEISIPRDTFTFTILRDPVKRVISHYKMLVSFKCNKIEHPAMKTEGRWLGRSFSDFVHTIPQQHLLRQIYMFSKRLIVDEAIENIIGNSLYFCLEDIALGREFLANAIGRDIPDFHVKKSSDNEKIDVSKHVEEELSNSEAEMHYLREILEPEYNVYQTIRQKSRERFAAAESKTVDEIIPVHITRLLDEQKNRDALECIDSEIKNNPGNDSLTYYKALALGRIGRYNEAISELYELLKRKPDNNEGKQLLEALECR
jgi:glycosyltransferase involved in cell wall biosynthesis